MGGAEAAGAQAARSGPDQALNKAVSALRAAEGTGELAPGVALADGIALHADPALELSGTFRAPAGRLVELEARVRGRGAYLALHLALGRADLDGCAWIGFACASAARDTLMIRAALRSTEGAGFTDAFFARHILATPEPASHVDALYLPALRTVPEAADGRELVLFLPRADFTWHLHDLRLFAR